MTKLRESIKNRKVYGNYSVYSPDGILMFRSNIKKINWYLNRNLAERIDDNSIKLTFEPNGLGCHGIGYGLDRIQNVCVVCGIDECLTKHHVVPRCYRIHFPEELKSHKFHDVLTMCLDCHYKYEEIAFLHKKKIAEDYDSPINGNLIDNKRMQKIKGLFMCLFDKSNIPKSRLDQIKEELRIELNVRKITKSLISKWINSKLDVPVVCTKTHGEMVIQKIDNVKDFITMWRSHFIENANPKFLPQNWSINHE